MNIDYKLFASQILEAAGGFDNIKDITHCLTRIRINYKNINKIDENFFKASNNIEGYRRFADQIQIIVGSDVSIVYKELLATYKSVDELNQEKRKFSFQSCIQFVSECMVQLFPGLIGCGTLKVILMILTLTKIISEQSSTYIILYSFADGFFYFLPIFLGYVIAKKQDGNPILYMCIGAALCYPSLVGLLEGSTLQLESFHGIKYTYLFGLPIICNTYPNTVLPMFLMSFFLKWIEEHLIGIGPKVLKPILGHTLYILISIPVVLFLVGPIGAILGKFVADASMFFYNVVPSLTIMILSVLMPFIIASGMHYIFIPIMIDSISIYGFDPVFIIAMYCSNLAQGGAALGVSLKTKNQDLKSHGMTGFVSAIVAGITEIAMYGINLRYKATMIAFSVAAGLGGLISGIFSLRAYQLGGSPSLLSIFTFFNKEVGFDGMYIGILIAVVVLICSTFLSFLLFKDDETIPENEIMPINGERIELRNVSNEVFASGIMGDGYGILPSDGKVYAPFDGICETIYETKHILFIKSNEGKRMMIHIGINSTFLEEDFFNVYIKEKEAIRKGQLLMEFDRKGIEDAGFNTESVIIYIEDDLYSE